MMPNVPMMPAEVDPTPIVAVQFFSERFKRYSGALYHYIADTPLEEGDVVTVPTSYGDKQAKVVRIDIPYSELTVRVGQLRHITAPATPGGGLFEGFC